MGNVDTRGNNSIWGRVYSPEGCSATLTDGGGLGAKTGLYAVPMRWQRTEKGKEFRRKAQKEVFNDGHRELVEKPDESIGCVTSALNKNALIGVVATQIGMSKQFGNHTSKDCFMTLRASEPNGVIISNTVTPDAYLARGERDRDENGKAVLTSMHKRRIRRLTPRECERLQGFSDGWTEMGCKGEKISDAQRYKMLGNAVSVPIVYIVMQRIIPTIFCD